VKKDVYAKVFGTKEYFLVNPESRKIEGFDLVKGEYREKASTVQGRVWCSQLEAYLGFWHGEWTEITAGWCRLFHADGSLVPTKAEAAEQRAEAERQRAEAERQRAEAERQRADASEQRAANEHRRAESAEAELARLHALLEGRSQD
jgi:hypothetical protein